MRPLRQGVHGAAEGGCAAWQGCSQTGAWWRGAPALSLAAHRRARGSGQRGRMRRQPRGSDHSSERMRERGSRIGEEEALVEEKRLLRPQRQISDGRRRVSLLGGRARQLLLRAGWPRPRLSRRLRPTASFSASVTATVFPACVVAVEGE